MYKHILLLCFIILIYIWILNQTKAYRPKFYSLTQIKLFPSLGDQRHTSVESLTATIFNHLAKILSAQYDNALQVLIGFSLASGFVKHTIYRTIH